MTKIKAPQIIWIALALLSIGLSIYYNGQPREGTYNGWFQLFGVSLDVLILYWGGFFTYQTK